MTALIDFFNNIKTSVISISITDIIEIIIIAILVYNLFKWIKNTRTWFVLKGLLVIGIFFIFANIFGLNIILYIVKGCLDILVIALIVIFQPELRSALERLGKENVILKFLSRNGKDELNYLTTESRDAIVGAAFDLSSSNIGALIVISKDYHLTEYEKTGIKMDAEISRQLLVNIFQHNTPLHDGAVIIHDNKITYSTCYLPLSRKNDISKAYGTRHRAAIGVSEVSDSITIVVSEETGRVSIAKDGKLYENVTYEGLKTELESMLVKKEDESIAEENKTEEVEA